MIPSQSQRQSRRDALRQAAAWAAVVDRRNRPRRLVFLAVGALLAATVFAGAGWIGAARARTASAAAAKEWGQVVELIGSARRIREDPQRELLKQRFRVEPLLGRIDESLRAGFDADQAKLGRESLRSVEMDWPLQLWTIDVNFPDAPDPEPALQWITRITSEIEGLHVTRFTAKPQLYGWNIIVEFGRWQWKASS